MKTQRRSFKTAFGFAEDEDISKSASVPGIAGEIEMYLKNEREELEKKAFKENYLTDLKDEKAPEEIIKLAKDMLNLSKLDLKIEKCAGIAISNPTVENVERFIQNYILNEFGYLQSVTPEAKQAISTTKILLLPNLVNNNNIVRATGVASMNFADSVIELPFIIDNGELLPFDLIQVGNQRVPYSRSNMVKVVTGIKKGLEEKKEGEEPKLGIDPYLKVDKLVNPSTSSGFLGRVMDIQDKYSGRSGSSASGSYSGGPQDNYVVASDKMLLMEKIAKINHMPINGYQYMVEHAVDVLEKKSALQEFTELPVDSELEKIAVTLKNQDWKNICSLESGTYVSVPVKDSTGISLKKGVIIREFFTPKREREDSDHISPVTNELRNKKEKAVENQINPKAILILCENDGVKYKAIDKNDSIIGLVDERPTFNIPMTPLTSVDRGSGFSFLSGDSIMPPVKLDNINTLDFSKLTSTFATTESKEELAETNYQFNKDTSNSKRPMLFSETYRVEYILPGDYGSRYDGSPDIKSFGIFSLEGYPLSYIPLSEYIEKKAKECVVSEEVIRNTMNDSLVFKKGRDDKDPCVLVSDRNNKVFLVRGEENNVFSRIEDIENEMFIETSDEPLLKSALEENTIEIKKGNYEGTSFDLKVKYVDNSKKVKIPLTKDMKGLEEYQMRGILKALDFSQNQIADIVFKLKQQNHVKISIPKSANPDKLTGAASTTAIGNAMSRIKGMVFSKAIKGELAGLAVEEITMKALDELSGKMASEKDAMDYFYKKADIAKDLSGLFEKIAVDNKSEKFKDVSATLMASSLYLEKTADCIKYEDMDLIDYRNISRDIESIEDEILKTASDIFNLRDDQIENDMRIIPNSYLKATNDSLFEMLKVAKFVAQEV